MMYSIFMLIWMNMLIAASNSLPSSIRSNFKFDDNSVIDDYRLDIQESVKSVNISWHTNLKDLLNDVYNSLLKLIVPF